MDFVDFTINILNNECKNVVWKVGFSKNHRDIPFIGTTENNVEIKLEFRGNQYGLEKPFAETAKKPCWLLTRLNGKLTYYPNPSVAIAAYKLDLKELLSAVEK